MYNSHIPLELLHGKEIEEIQFDEWDESMIIRFTDKCSLIILAEKFNCSGARIIIRVLTNRVSKPQNKNDNK